MFKNSSELMKILLCREKTGVKGGDIFMSYKSIFQDVRNAVDWVHIHVSLCKRSTDQIKIFARRVI
jgi:5'-nucleotidase